MHQQQSFNLMLTCQKKQFTGRLSCTYDRPYRLCGSWEVTLISFTRTNAPVYILCDLLEYSNVNQCKVQLLDYFYSWHDIKSGGHTQYVKLLHKRFSTINIDIKIRLESAAVVESSEDWNFSNIFATEAGEEVTCLLHFRRIG